MTTNGKGSIGEPSLGIQTRKGLIYVSTTNCVPSNGPVSDGEEEALAGAASVTTNLIPYYLDKKYRREDTSVLCRGVINDYGGWRTNL